MGFQYKSKVFYIHVGFIVDYILISVLGGLTFQYIPKIMLKFKGPFQSSQEQ